MSKITSQDVSNWMRQQLDRAHKTSEYAAVTVFINQYRKYPEGSDPIAKFSIYCGQGNANARELESIEACFSALAEFKPIDIAKAKREQAAKLLAEAEQIESQTIPTP